jgi:hypothetical protein
MKLSHPFGRGSVACVLCLLAASVTQATAQNAGSPGQSWSGTWNFGSPADRGLALQTAQAIRAARQAPLSPVYNTYNTTDNRTNYQEYVGGDGSVMGGSFQVGDQIGQNTNSIGSMNTGTTNIEITGSNNAVNATNGADNSGCVDGSIGINTVGAISPASTMGIDISIGALQPPSPCR